jgi:hypothetical protein
MNHFIIPQLNPFWRLQAKLVELQKNKKENPNGIPSEAERKELVNFINAVVPLCQRLEFEDLFQPMSTAALYIEIGPDENYSGIEKSFQTILTAISFKLDLCHFAYIPNGKTQFFEQPELFGEAVNKSFPSAKNDIKSAGNCRVAELHSAAMYHLMCVVNIGLIALAGHLRVRIKKTPLKYADWQPMLDKLEKKMKQKTVRPPGDKKSQAEARKFYNGLLAEFKYFKDLRNDVMHARSNYKEPDVENGYIRVRDFMKRMADGGISESH